MKNEQTKTSDVALNPPANESTMLSLRNYSS